MDPLRDNIHTPGPLLVLGKNQKTGEYYSICEIAPSDAFQCGRKISGFTLGAPDKKRQAWQAQFNNAAWRQVAMRVHPIPHGRRPSPCRVTRFTAMQSLSQ